MSELAAYWIIGVLLCTLFVCVRAIRNLNSENNALRDQLEAHADTLIGYDKTIHDYNDSCNFEAK